MKSLRTKIVLLVMWGCILSAGVVGILSIRNTKAQIQEDSATLMNQAMMNSSQEIDAAVSRIEQSVETMAACVMNALTDLDKFQSDAQYVEDFTRSMENTLLSAAENTEGAITAYIRYNPAFTEPTSGLFFSRDNANSSFSSLTPTDFSIYEATDTAHVGWYYLPVKNGAATWMAPYFNENLQVYMVSFVVPLIKDGVSVGVVGMDIDFRQIQNIVDHTSIYDTGYAFLTDPEGLIMHHPKMAINEKISDINSGGKLDGLLEALSGKGTGGGLVSYEYENTVKKMACQQLKNGMWLVLTAPRSEINASENRLMLLISISTAFAILVSVLFSLIIVRGIVKPIEELKNAAGKIAQGDLDVTVICRSRDEIGALADSFRLTVKRLKEYIRYIKEISEVLENIAGGNLVFELHHDYTGEFSAIKTALLNISDSLTRTLLEIRHASEQVTSGSEQVSSGAQALSQGATQQAASVQELSATVNEISDKVKQSAKLAKEAHTLSKEAEAGVEESNRNMLQMAESIHNIEVASEKINQIVKTVEDIASQTNILALNAAVESARAGEAGKGFAVVAGEVRSLATQVNDATKNIARLVQDAVNAVKTGTAIAGKTEESLITVVEKSTAIEAKVQEISDKSQWQAASMEQVNLGIDQISAVVQTNSATAQEGAAASEEMSRQAQLLRDLIRQFHLGDGVKE